MDDRQALKLLVLLNQYATDHGMDVSPDITVKQLADDLADSMSIASAVTQCDQLRFSIYDNLNLEVWKS